MKESPTTWLLAAVMGATLRLLRAREKCTRRWRSGSDWLPCALTSTSSHTLKSCSTVRVTGACSTFYCLSFHSQLDLETDVMQQEAPGGQDRLVINIVFCNYDVWCRPAVQGASSSLPLPWTSPMAVVPRYNPRGSHASGTSYWLENQSYFHKILQSYTEANNGHGLKRISEENLEKLHKVVR